MPHVRCSCLATKAGDDDDDDNHGDLGDDDDNNAEAEIEDGPIRRGLGNKRQSMKGPSGDAKGKAKAKVRGKRGNDSGPRKGKGKRARSEKAESILSMQQTLGALLKADMSTSVNGREKMFIDDAIAIIKSIADVFQVTCLHSNATCQWMMHMIIMFVFCREVDINR